MYSAVGDTSSALAEPLAHCTQYRLGQRVVPVSVKSAAGKPAR
jgi:hypothetical protein